MKTKLLVVLIILIVLLSLDVLGHGSEEHAANDSQKEVYDVVRTCLSQSEETDACYVKSCKNESKYPCAKEILEAAVLISGPEKAMEILYDIKASPLFGIKTDGHLLAHVIGRSTANYLGKTGRSFLRCPNGFNYGCQHGFFEIMLVDHEEPVKASESICENLPPAPFKDKFYCYHGVGHALMFYENYDLMKALSLCDSLPDPAFQEACWQGAFMENANGRNKEEPAALLSFKEDDPLAPCNSVEAKYREQCYLNHAGYLIYLNDYLNDSVESASNACLGAGDHVRACMISLGLMATVPNWQEMLAGSFEGNFIETAAHMCNRFPAEHIETCQWAVVAGLLHFEPLNPKQSSEFCMEINVTSECFKWIGILTNSVVVDDDQYEKVCNTLPNEFKDDCLSQREGLPSKDDRAYDKTSAAREPEEDDRAYDKTSAAREPEEDDSLRRDQRQEKGLAFFVRDLLKKIWIIFRASLELIRDEIFFGGLTEEKTIGAPGQVLKPERSQEEEVYSIDVPTKVLKPEQDSELLLHDDSFMDEMIKTYNLRSLTKSLDRLGHSKGIDCHNRAHELGRRAYQLLGSEAFKSCGVECHSGCRHGATEAFFAKKGTDNLLHSIKLLCGGEKGIFGLHQCIHGTGHGLMAWFDYDLHRALKACDLIETENHRNSCHSGVFMENIGGAIAISESGKEDYHVTRYLNDDPHYPCNIVDDKYKGMCYYLQTDRILWLLGSIRRVGEECAKIPEQFQNPCFLSMGRTTSGSLSRDPVKSFEACGTVQNINNRNTCLRGVLADLLWDETHAERAISFCKLNHHPSFQDGCYDKLINSAAQVIPQARMKNFCGKLPRQYREKCNAAEPTPALPLSVRNETEPAADVQKTDNAVIRYANGEYVPSEVHVSVGQKVTWINDDQAFWPASNLHPTHAAYPGSDIIKCFTSEKDAIFDACEAKGKGESYTFTFNTAGSWRFHDHINPRATGTVIVSE